MREESGEMRVESGEEIVKRGEWEIGRRFPWSEEPSVETLEERVVRWAVERDLYAQSTPGTRVAKFVEEAGELTQAVVAYIEAGEKDWELPSEALIPVELEAGDVLVTLINLLHPMGLDLRTCLESAYRKIQHRKGRMINGMFVKQGDTRP